ncbi:MAG: efflux RND transporter periplasmic adaptor subunit [Rhodospirillaceae bacterium]|nr:MAG: efflux RND transporter periplasmic adaptor subunit [Rhodospirillaceae bacterium]
MNDKSSLLNQLRIDRGGDSEPGGRGPLWAGIAAVVVMAAAVGGWLIFSGPSGVSIHVAIAAAAASGTRGAGSLLDASGYVVARRAATVSSKITGKVSEVLIEEGQHVENGQVIARLDDSNARAALDQAKANLASAEAAYANVKPVHKRNIELAAHGWISETALDQSKGSYQAAETGLAVARAGLVAAQRNLDDTTIRAPFTGVVTVKAAQPGEIVSPISAGGGFTRTGIGTIVDMDSLEVEVDVSESFISRVHSEQPATIKLNAYPDWQIPAEVITVIPTADRAKATVKVRIAFKEKDARVVPEMGARVSFLNDTASGGQSAASPGVVVPAEAVQGKGDTGVVYLVRGDKVERRAVRLGASTGDGQTILAGLVAGDRVAVGDLTQLSDGTRVHVE